MSTSPLKIWKRGDTYGAWEITGPAHPVTDARGRRKTMVTVRCACGKAREIRLDHLKAVSRSCGCQRSYNSEVRVRSESSTPMKVTSDYGQRSSVERITPKEDKHAFAHDDWRVSLLMGARRSGTPWRDCAELVRLSVEETKEMYESNKPVTV